jgi:transcriptional regulator with GAF, ATPase, and Fis domain
VSRKDSPADVTRTLGSATLDDSTPEFVRVIVAHSSDPAMVAAPRVLGDEALVIGRAGPGLALADPRISRAHASLELRAGVPFVRDLGSRNGTFVNGERIDETRLANEDVVRVGDHLLVVQALGGDDVRRAIEAPPALDSLVGDGRAIRALREDVVRAATGDVAVLLLGETGTGKELVAGEIHRLSGRSGKFVPVNCAAIPEHLAEGELFGYVRGAFTGAVGDSVGLFGAADGGTILLDEIGEMPLSLQAKLLRALSTGEVRRVGETSARKLDVRAVAATNVDLVKAAGEDRFRPDLLARLAGHVVSIPSLRQRREDVLFLAAHFLSRALDLRAQSPHELVAKSFSPDAAEALLLSEWPFNVRGLEQTMRAAATRMDGRRLELAHLGAAFRVTTGRQSNPGPPPEPSSPLVRILEVRPDAVPSGDELRAVVAHFGGNVSRIAAFFGKERRQIYRWAERHAIDLETAREE